MEARPAGATYYKARRGTRWTYGQSECLDAAAAGTENTISERERQILFPQLGHFWLVRRGREENDQATGDTCFRPRKKHILLAICSIFLILHKITIDVRRQLRVSYRQNHTQFGLHTHLLEMLALQSSKICVQWRSVPLFSFFLCDFTFLDVMRTGHIERENGKKW